MWSLLCVGGCASRIVENEQEVGAQEVVAAETSPLVGLSRDGYRLTLHWVLEDMARAAEPVGPNAEFLRQVIPNVPANYRHPDTGKLVTYGREHTLQELIQMGMEVIDKPSTQFIRDNAGLFGIEESGEATSFRISDEWLALLLVDMPWAQITLAHELKHVDDYLYVPEEIKRIDGIAIFEFGNETRAWLPALAYAAYAHIEIEEEDPLRKFAKTEYLHAREVRDFSKDTRWIETFGRLSSMSVSMLDNVERNLKVLQKAVNYQIRPQKITREVKRLTKIALVIIQNTTQLTDALSGARPPSSAQLQTVKSVILEHVTYRIRGSYILQQAIQLGVGVGIPAEHIAFQAARETNQRIESGPIQTMVNRLLDLVEHTEVVPLPARQETDFLAWLQRHPDKKVSDRASALNGVTYRNAASSNHIKAGRFYYQRGTFDGLETD